MCRIASIGTAVNGRVPGTLMRATVLSVAVSCGGAASAPAGQAVRVGATSGNVENIGVGGGRVIWASWDDDEVSVFSAGLAGSRRRIHREVGLGSAEWVAPMLSASSHRVAFFLEETTSGVDAEYVALRTTASAPIDSRRLTRFRSTAPGYERLQDTAADAVLTTAVRRADGRSSVRAYVRDFATADPAPQPVGARLRLAPSEPSSTVEARLTERWMAVLRRSETPTVTVYDRHTGRQAWRVTLPRPASDGSPYAREIVWDLADDGTVAAALAMSRSRVTLGWAAPRSSFHRVTSSVLVRAPFVVDGGRLTYARRAHGTMLRLYSRALAGAARAESGDIPTTSTIGSDGHQVGLAVTAPRGLRTCVFAAALPVAAGQPWICRSPGRAQARAASLPIAGSHYRGALVYGPGCPDCHGTISLTVADDRRSLLPPAGLSFDTQCEPTPDGGFGLTGYSNLGRPPDGTAVRADGGYRWTFPLAGATEAVVAGGFAKSGHVATGTLSYRAESDTGATCDFAASFRARVVGRPYRPRAGRTMHCPDFARGEVSITIRHRDAGCTVAIDIARRWRFRSGCRGEPGRPRACVVDGYRCRPVDAGRLHSLTSVGCTDPHDPGSLVELVAGWRCDIHDDETSIDAINTVCTGASALASAWKRRKACYDPGRAGATCSLAAGWRCAASVANYGPAGLVVSLCRRVAAAREAMRITWVLPV